MAHRLKWWGIVPLGVCLIIALAYLPPRAMPLLGQRFFRVFQTFEPPTPYHLRVQELANRYRITSFELTMRKYKQTMGPELERRRALEIPGPVVYFPGPDTLSDWARGLVRGLLATAWARLGLGVSKIAVGVVVPVVFDRPPGGDSPAHMPEAAAFLLPDSTDRATCLAYVPIIYWRRPGVLTRALPASSEELADLLRNGLGTCAYFAAFGAPGHDIGRWLSSRHYEFAKFPWMLRAAESARAGDFLDHDQPWFWSFVYRYEPDAVECMAGRSGACRHAILGLGTGDGAPVVSTEQDWRKPASLAGADRYFADVIGDVGPERFRRFWNSDLPVDTALAATMRMPVSEWTRRWQATIVPPIRLGPAAPLGATLLATMLGIVAVLIVALTASRREVR